MNGLSSGPLQRLRIALARAKQVLGWAGIVGVGLLVPATVVSTLAWSTHLAFLRRASALDASVSQAVRLAPALRVPFAAKAPLTPALAQLPPASDIPLLLTQMKQAAVANGLEWRAAEYRIAASTPAQPAALEVRFSLKGPYPKLRGMLVQLKDAIPALAIREFTASRLNADIADIDAKLTLAVFLQDGVLGSDAALPAVLNKATP